MAKNILPYIKEEEDIENISVSRGKMTPRKKSHWSDGKKGLSKLRRAALKRGDVSSMNSNFGGEGHSSWWDWLKKKWRLNSIFIFWGDFLWLREYWIRQFKWRRYRKCLLSKLEQLSSRESELFLMEIITGGNVLKYIHNIDKNLDRLMLKSLVLPK